MNKGKKVSGEVYLNNPLRSVVSIILLIIAAIYCIARILPDYLSTDRRDPFQTAVTQPASTSITTPPLAIHQFDCLQETTLRQIGAVVHIIDGDTIDVRLEDGEIYRVRYIGIDTPERDEFYFNESSAENSRLVAGQTIILLKDVSETDRFGRLLRYVLIDEVFVNYELVVQGFAHAITYPPDVACQPTYIEAERFARENNLGLWAYETPSPP